MFKPLIEAAGKAVRAMNLFIASLSIHNRRIRKAFLKGDAARFNYYVKQHKERFNRHYPQMLSVYDDNYGI